MRRDIHIDDINKKTCIYGCINIRSCSSKIRCNVPNIITSLLFITDFSITIGIQPYISQKLGIVPICKV